MMACPYGSGFRSQCYAAIRSIPHAYPVLSVHSFAATYFMAHGATLRHATHSCRSLIHSHIAPGIYLPQPYCIPFRYLFVRQHSKHTLRRRDTNPHTCYTLVSLPAAIHLPCYCRFGCTAFSRTNWKASPFVRAWLREFTPYPAGYPLSHLSEGRLQLQYFRRTRVSSVEDTRNFYVKNWRDILLILVFLIWFFTSVLSL